MTTNNVQDVLQHVICPLETSVLLCFVKFTHFAEFVFFSLNSASVVNVLPQFAVFCLFVCMCFLKLQCIKLSSPIMLNVLLPESKTSNLFSHFI